MTPQIVVFNPSAFTAPVVSQSGGAWSLLLGPFNLSITVYLHVTSAESGGFTNLTAFESDLFRQAKGKKSWSSDDVPPRDGALKPKSRGTRRAWTL